MGDPVNDIVEIGTFGVVEDVTGSEAAAEAVTRGAQQSSEAIQSATTEALAANETLRDDLYGIADPYIGAGTDAMAQYQSMLESGYGEEFDFDYSPFKFNARTYEQYKDPAYDLRLREGARGINSAAGAGGMRMSGKTLKELERFSQDYASSEYSNAYNRAYGEYSDDYNRAFNEYSTAYNTNYNQWLNDLSSKYNLANLGFNASSNLMNTTAALGSSNANLIVGGGQSEAQLASDLASIEAAQATSGWNQLMDVAGLGVTASTGLPAAPATNVAKTDPYSS